MATGKLLNNKFIKQFLIYILKIVLNVCIFFFIINLLSLVLPSLFLYSVTTFKTLYGVKKDLKIVIFNYNFNNKM